jgi:hypothetical protein
VDYDDAGHDHSRPQPQLLNRKFKTGSEIPKKFNSKISPTQCSSLLSKIQEL